MAAGNGLRIDRVIGLEGQPGVIEQIIGVDVLGCIVFCVTAAAADVYKIACHVAGVVHGQYNNLGGGHIGDVQRHVHCLAKRSAAGGLAAPWDSVPITVPVSRSQLYSGTA